MSSSFKREKRKGGLAALAKRLKFKGVVDVGIIDAGKHSGSDLTVASIGLVHEFGATIDHPGGTPFRYNYDGQVIFLKKGDSRAVNMTEPHKIIIPERSFIRSTLKEKRKEIIARQIKLLKKIAKGELTEQKALGLLGEFVSDLIKQKIKSLKSPPNAPITIKRKGSSNPLIDEGQLANSITYKVKL